LAAKFPAYLLEDVETIGAGHFQIEKNHVRRKVVRGDCQWF
jgi:hypothetical protein